MAEQGVYWLPSKQKWQALVGYDNMKIPLGYFHSKLEAQQALETFNSQNLGAYKVVCNGPKNAVALNGMIADILVIRETGTIHHILVDTADISTLTGCFLSVLPTTTGYRVQLRHNGSNTYLHRFLLKPSPEEDIDHIDGNALNNTRQNLRVVDKFINQQNRSKANSNSGTGVLNVSRRTDGRYMARVHKNGECHNLGTFDTLDAAAQVVKAFKQKHDYPVHDIVGR